MRGDAGQSASITRLAIRAGMRYHAGRCGQSVSQPVWGTSENHFQFIEGEWQVCTNHAQNIDRVVLRGRADGPGGSENTLAGRHWPGYSLRSRSCGESIGRRTVRGPKAVGRVIISRRFLARDQFDRARGLNLYVSVRHQGSCGASICGLAQERQVRLR